MTKQISYFEYGQVYPPLTKQDGEGPVVPESERAPLRPWAVIALLWYICHVSIIGAVIVTLWIDAEGYCTSQLQAIAPIPAAVLLWAVTLFVRRMASGGNLDLG